MILTILFCLAIILYWFAEGVTEGYTWAKPKRRKENKLICLHMGKGHAGMFDYHAWRILENIGIWGTVILSFFLDICWSDFFILGIGSWFIGTFCYEAALNYVNKNTIWKPIDFKWHILGYDIPWWGGKRLLALPTIGATLILYAIIF